MQSSTSVEFFGTPVFDASPNSIIDEDDQHTGVVIGSSTPPPLAREPEPTRHWRDVFWLAVFVLHLLLFGLVLGVLGLNRFREADRLNLDKYTKHNGGGGSDYTTEMYWPIYGTAAGLGAIIAWAWLLFLCRKGNQMMKFCVHSVTTYLALVSVFCFWIEEIFWGIACAIGAALQFLYVLSVMNRFPFSMLVLRKAVKMLWELPETAKVSYAFLIAMLMWMVLWSFGVSGVVASNIADGGRWWLLVIFSVSLFWTGAVFCNVVHVIVAGLVTLVLIHGGRTSPTMPPKPLLRSFKHSVTTSLGSVCYGSLFTAAIRTMRWGIRGMRSLIERNECLLCCVNFLFNLVETLVRFFNKYAYVQVAITGKGFNHSACDAWELFQSTGIEALVAYDCSGAILLMTVILGGLLTGSCAGTWAWLTSKDEAVMIGSTAMIMGMVLVQEHNRPDSSQFSFMKDLDDIVPPEDMFIEDPNQTVQSKERNPVIKESEGKKKKQHKKKHHKQKSFKSGDKDVKFDSYNGRRNNDKALAFIRQFEVAFAEGNFKERSKLRHVSMYLKGPASS
ncbi:hypothetical protein L7F22_052000 [Adiantum nelumboides]|nr:hypothetical protein [Adiantum nelumboides]